MTAETGPATLDVVAFRVAGMLFGIEAEQVRGSRRAEDATEATAAEALLGLTPSRDPTHRLVLTIKDHPADWALEIDAPIELRTLAANAIHPLPALLAARTSLNQLRALAWTDEEPMALLDLRGPG